MTDYPDLYKRLAQEILKHEGRIAGDAQAFVATLAAQLQASGQQLTPEIQAELTRYLTAMQAAINTGIVNAATIAAATMPVNLQSATVAKLAEQAFTEQWPDGLKLSDRLWNWQGNVKAGLTKTLQSGIKQGAGVNKIVYDMQRSIERAAGGQRFKIVETYKDDWVKELHKSAVELIHDPSAKAAWEATVSDVEDRLLGLKENGSKAAAERVFSQIRLAVTKGNELLADKAVKWWLYDKQLTHLKRIARTEMATAMHRAVIASVDGDESIIGFQWRLSGSHPITDICDYYANIEMGLGKGVFTKEAVPHHKAHPHCMCLLIPRVTPIKQKGSNNYADFVKNSPPERQQTLLPKWAQVALKSGTPIERLIRPDGLGLINKPAMEAFITAKNGGDYAKFYQQYQAKYSKELDKATRSYRKVVEEHQQWIDNPALKLGENASDETIAIYRMKWQRDIKRNQAYKDIVDGLLQERKI